MDIGGGRRSRCRLLPPTLSGLFPHDIMKEILLRLSVKKLSQLCCVCKQWSAVISDPDFRRQHLRRSQQNPLLVLGWTYKYDALDVTPPPEYLTSVDIKHGATIQKAIALPKKVNDDINFILSSSGWLDLICLVGMTHVYACNPFTGALITLPKPPNRACFGNVAIGRLPPPSMDYKLVYFFTNEFYVDGKYTLTTSCEILTLVCGTTTTTVYHWRDVEDTPAFALNHCYMASINGTIYLMACEESDDHVDGDNLMAAFDIERETFKVFSPPACCSDPQHIRKRYFIRPFELEGSLCLADGTSSMLLDLWLLKEDSNKSHIWVKEYSIDSSFYPGPYGPYFDKVHPIAIVDGKILMEILPWGNLAYYDPRSKKFSDFEVKMPGAYYGCLFHGGADE